MYSQFYESDYFSAQMDYARRMTEFKERIKDEPLEFLEMYKEHLEKQPEGFLERLCRSLSSELALRYSITEEVLEEKIKKEEKKELN